MPLPGTTHNLQVNFLTNILSLLLQSSISDTLMITIRVSGVADPRNDFIWKIRPNHAIILWIHPLNQQQQISQYIYPISVSQMDNFQSILLIWVNGLNVCSMVFQ